MKDYEQSYHPTEATTDQTILLVHNQIMWEKRSLLYDMARQTCMCFWTVVYLEQCLRDAQNLS